MAGKITWLTGQPGSGKTTLALEMQAEGMVDFIVDGDDLRILDNPGYDRAGRERNIDRAQAIAAYLASHKYNVAVSLVAPYRDQRERFKQKFGVREIYLHTDEIRGREEYFVQDYEPPLEKYTDLDTGKLTVDECLLDIRLVTS